jgi:predicted AlkP superfamily phosphohydrolase/phosphomutase
MTDERPGRVMIIGLDGATLDLIRPWADAGILPTFKRLFKDGASGTLRSTIPPITPAAWSSFMTGVNPGKHGVFDFTMHKDDAYELNMVRSTNRQAPSIWQLASQAGRRVAVFNVPVTYPPERVNGFMVSGLMTPPTARDASWPPELQKELEQAVPGWGFLTEELFERGREAEYVRTMMQVNQTTYGVASHLMNKAPWDLFVTVFQTPDLMSHFMWQFMETHAAGSPEPVREVLANAMQECYRDIDAKLARLIGEAGDDAYVMLVSDHGHGRMDNYIAVNTWLLAKGYICLKRDWFTRLKYLLYRLHLTPSNFFSLAEKFKIGSKVRRASGKRAGAVKQRLKSIFISFNDVDWSRTRAYSTGYCGPIYVNLKGRETNGIINPGPEYEALLDQLAADLMTLKEPGNSGLPLVGKIHRGHDIYSGPFAERAPDLVFFPRDWRYMVLGSGEFLSTSWIGKSANKTGHHRMEGIFFLSGPGIKPGYSLQDASIVDVAPTTLALLGVPIPKSMDGCVLAATMTPELCERLRIAYAGEAEFRPEYALVRDLTPEDEEILVERLRNLGYIA